jgi:hypothetical protein
MAPPKYRACILIPYAKLSDHLFRRYNCSMKTNWQKSGHIQTCCCYGNEIQVNTEHNFAGHSCAMRTKEEVECVCVCVRACASARSRVCACVCARASNIEWAYPLPTFRGEENLLSVHELPFPVLPRTELSNHISTCFNNVSKRVLQIRLFCTLAYTWSFKSFKRHPITTWAKNCKIIRNTTGLLMYEVNITRKCQFHT